MARRLHPGGRHPHLRRHLLRHLRVRRARILGGAAVTGDRAADGAEAGAAARRHLRLLRAPFQLRALLKEVNLPDQEPGASKTLRVLFR